MEKLTMKDFVKEQDIQEFPDYYQVRCHNCGRIEQDSKENVKDFLYSLMIKGWKVIEEDGIRKVYCRNCLNPKIEDLIEKLIEEFKEFLEAVKIQRTSIDELINDLPARKGRYLLALAKMEAELMKAKIEEKRIYYRLYKEYRNEKQKKGLTEEGIKSLIYTDEEYQQIQDRLVELNYKVEILRKCVEILSDLGRMVYLIKGTPNTLL